MAQILLIEPDTVLARLYRRAFEAAGNHVLLATSAQQAVHAADSHRPDIVILELQLRTHNGIEFLHEFRSYREWLDIPIVVHSFVPPTEFNNSPVLYRELGVAQYLYKPTTSLAKLTATVQNLVPTLI